MAEHTGCHTVPDLFVLAGVEFAVLTAGKTTIPPIVAVDELFHVRSGRTVTRARTADRE